MELIYYPTPCRKKNAADDDVAAVATIGIVRNERGGSLSREDQGGHCQVLGWRHVAFLVAMAIAVASTGVVSHLLAGCRVDANVSTCCPLDPASTS